MPQKARYTRQPARADKRAIFKVLRSSRKSAAMKNRILGGAVPV